MTGQLRRGLHLAGSGVPRLWRAARRAGAGRAEALDVVLASTGAFTLAAQQAPTQWRQQNAVRHFVWQAYLTARHGRRLAQAVASEQEAGTTDPVDSGVDERNNALGQEYGTEHAASLRAQSRDEALSHLAEVGARLWDERVLASATLKDGTDPRDA